MSVSTASAVILVETTQQMFERLQKTYSSHQGELEAAPAALAEATSGVDKLYSSLQSGTSALSLDALRIERSKYQGVFSKFAGLRSAAEALRVEFQEWSVLTGRATEAQPHVTQISTLCAALNTPLTRYGDSLKYFCAVVDNEGRPLSYFQRSSVYFQRLEISPAPVSISSVHHSEEVQIGEGDEKEREAPATVSAPSPVSAPPPYSAPVSAESQSSAPLSAPAVEVEGGDEGGEDHEGDQASIAPTALSALPFSAPTEEGDAQMDVDHADNAEADGSGEGDDEHELEVQPIPEFVPAPVSVEPRTKPTYASLAAQLPKDADGITRLKKRNHERRV